MPMKPNTGKCGMECDTDNPWGASCMQSLVPVLPESFEMKRVESWPIHKMG